MKKLLALFLALTMLFSLAACNTGEAQDSGTSYPNDSFSPVVTDSPSPPAADDPPTPSIIVDPADVKDINDFTQLVARVDADTVMFTVNGEAVTAEYYFYWLANDCYNLDMNYQIYLGRSLDFGALAPDGSTVAEYLKKDAQGGAINYTVLEQQAYANGCGMTEEQQAEFAQVKAQDVENSGAEEFGSFLLELGLTEPTFDRLCSIQYLSENMLAKLSHAPTDEERDQYIQENQIYSAKHILIQTVSENADGTVTFYRGGAPTNEDGSPYTGTADEYNAAVLEKVNSLLAQLAAADDLPALFDQLMNQYSEDGGLATNPDGYTFGPGEMVPEFEEGVKDLAYGAYSVEPVLSDFGYHIILRLRPEVSDGDCRSWQMQNMLSGWVDAAEVVTTDAYDALDVADFYARYSAYQKALMAQTEG